MQQRNIDDRVQHSRISIVVEERSKLQEIVTNDEMIGTLYQVMMKIVDWMFKKCPSLVWMGAQSFASNLDTRKPSDRWVVQLLTNDEKAQTGGRVTRVSQIASKNFIGTSMYHHHIPRSKQQSRQPIAVGKALPKTFPSSKNLKIRTRSLLINFSRLG